MATNAPTEIITHIKIPWAKGLHPTDFTNVLDIPAPIKNRVNENPFFAMYLNC